MDEEEVFSYDSENVKWGTEIDIEIEIDNTMKENSFKLLLHTTNKFGSYQIEGNLLLLGVVVNKSVQSFLYL